MILPAYGAGFAVHGRDPACRRTDGRDLAAEYRLTGRIFGDTQLHVEARIDRTRDQRVVEPIQRGSIPLHAARVAGTGLHRLLRRILRHVLDRRHRRAPHQLVRVAVDSAHVSILAAKRDDVADLAIAVENRRRDEIEVLPVFRRRLIPPLQRAGARIQHDDRRGKQICSRAVALVDVGPGVAHWHEQLTSRHVERHRAPHAATAGFRGLRLEPRFSTGLLAHRDRVEAPQLAPRLRVIRHHATANADLAARDRHVHDAGPGERRGGCGFTEARRGNHALPQKLAARGIERDESPVAGAAKHAAVHHRDASIRRRVALFLRLISVLPANRAIRGIDGYGLEPGVRVDHAIHDDHAGVHGGRAVDLHAAHFTELRRIRRRDLFQRREALPVEAIVIREPLATERSLRHRLLRLRSRGGKQRAGGEQGKREA